MHEPQIWKFVKRQILLQIIVALKRAVVSLVKLTSKTIQCASLSFQSIDYVHRCNGLTFGMFGVRNSVPNNVFQKDFQHTTGFLVNQTRNSLHSASACQPSNSRLRYSLDIVSQNFPVPLSATFPKTFTPFSSTSHDDAQLKTQCRMILNFLHRHILWNNPILIDQSHEAMGVTRPAPPFPENEPMAWD